MEIVVISIAAYSYIAPWMRKWFRQVDASIPYNVIISPLSVVSKKCGSEEKSVFLTEIMSCFRLLVLCLGCNVRLIA